MRLSQVKCTSDLHRAHTFTFTLIREDLIMSWQGYVDNNLVGTGKVSMAAIIGLKGGVWASSPGLNVSTEEQTAIIKGLDDPSPLQANGIFVSGKKYLTLQANPRSIYGKAGVRISGN